MNQRWAQLERCYTFCCPRGWFCFVIYINNLRPVLTLTFADILWIQLFKQTCVCIDLVWRLYFSSRGRRKFRVICKGLLASLPTYLDHNQNLNRIPNSYKQQYSNLILHCAVRARPGRIFSFPRHSCGAIRTAMLSTRSVASNCCNLIVDFISWLFISAERTQKLRRPRQAEKRLWSVSALSNWHENGRTWETDSCYKKIHNSLHFKRCQSK